MPCLFAVIAAAAPGAATTVGASSAAESKASSVAFLITLLPGLEYDTRPQWYGLSTGSVPRRDGLQALAVPWHAEIDGLAPQEADQVEGAHAEHRVALADGGEDLFAVGVEAVVDEERQTLGQQERAHQPGRVVCGFVDEVRGRDAYRTYTEQAADGRRPRGSGEGVDDADDELASYPRSYLEHRDRHAPAGSGGERPREFVRASDGARKAYDLMVDLVCEEPAVDREGVLHETSLPRSIAPSVP